MMSKFSSANLQLPSTDFIFPDLNCLVAVGLHHLIISLHIPTKIHKDPMKTQRHTMVMGTEKKSKHYVTIIFHLSQSLITAQLICNIFATTARKPS